MKRILLDTNIPVALKAALSAWLVETAKERGWNELVNGHLLRVAETERFDILITADQNIRYQQNLAGRRLALIVLSTNRWATLQPEVSRIVDGINRMAPGGYAEIRFLQPPLRRRPYKP